VVLAGGRQWTVDGIPTGLLRRNQRDEGYDYGFSTRPEKCFKTLESVSIGHLVFQNLN